MTNSNSNFKTFILNVIDFLSFGFSLCYKGACDKRIRGKYNLSENCENQYYTKEEASKRLQLSVRQFDRRVKQGLLPEGQRLEKSNKLFWNKSFIDKVSNTKNK